MNTKTSYYQRCQQWLDANAAITVETLEQTLDKFALQLEGLADDELALAEDLMRTMELLDMALAERQAPAMPGITPGQAAPAGQGQEAAESLLDFSPLLPTGPAAPVLSAAEKQQRLQTLLATADIRRGVDGLKRR